MEFSHYSVMLQECIDGLNIRPDGIYIDATAGGAGHSAEIARRLATGRLLALDQDPEAVETAQARLAEFPVAKVVRCNFSEMVSVAKQCGVEQADGILMDLGVSSHQFDIAERGFSYRFDGPLDMRMSKAGLTAADLINTLSVDELTQIIRKYGEERYAFSIAKNVARVREDAPITTTIELTEIIKRSMPAAARREKNPSKRTFQALRIAVNGEMEHLEEGLNAGFELLGSGGRFAVISFHSLEDRLVKQQFREWCTGCTCPPEFPVCVCGKKPQAKLVNRKPITASPEELEQNKRSHSAKLRILEKL